MFDTNGDGFILHGEIQALFDDKEEATRLFIDLDRITGMFCAVSLGEQ